MSLGGRSLSSLGICCFFHCTTCLFCYSIFRYFVQKHMVSPSLQGLGNALGVLLISKGTNANPIIFSPRTLPRSNIGFWKPGFDLLEHHFSLLTVLKCTCLYFEEYCFVLAALLCVRGRLRDCYPYVPHSLFDEANAVCSSLRSDIEPP